MTSKVPEDINEVARVLVNLETGIATREEELRKMKSSHQYGLDALHRKVLDLIGIQKKIIYTFDAGVLCNKEVNAEVFSITVDEQGFIIVSFMKSPNSYLLADVEQPVFETSLGELIGTKRGKYIDQEKKS